MTIAIKPQGKGITQMYQLWINGEMTGVYGTKSAAKLAAIAAIATS